MQTQLLGGRGALPSRRSLHIEHLWGMAAPNGADARAGGTGRRAQAVVAAYGVRAGDGSPQRRGPIGRGDGPSCSCGRLCLWNACGGWQPPTARAHRLRGWGVLPRRRPLLMKRLRGIAAPNAAHPLAVATKSPAQAVFATHERLRGLAAHRAGAHWLGGRGVLPGRRPLPLECLRGMATSNGAGLLARGMRSHAHAVVVAYGAPRGDGSPQPRGPTGWGDWESCPGGDCYFWSV